MSDYIGYRIEIVCLIGTLSTFQHFTQNLKPSEPLLLTNGTLRCVMYPKGKVAISRHLSTPGFHKYDHIVGKLSGNAGFLCSEV